MTATFDVFSGIIEINDGRSIGKAGENLLVDETRRREF